MIRAQDLVLKPATLAIILAVVSTLVLGCRPSIERHGPGVCGCVNPRQSGMNNVSNAQVIIAGLYPGFLMLG